MSTRLPASNPLAYVGLKETNPPQLYFRNRAPTAADTRAYDVGDIWIDQTALEAWILVLRIGAVATWIACAGTGAAETLTGDAGGAVGTDGADNINILGNSVGFQNGIQITGTPGNNTLTAMDLRNITVYVVDAVAGQTEYQTVQAAIDAAQAAGGGTVYVRPGTYTEDLVLYDAVDITAAVATPAGFQTTIIGVHTPPAAGDMSFRNLALSDTTDILASAAAGTTTIVIIDCVIDVANGYTFNMPNWTGLIVFMNSHCIGTQDGFADIGAGGANFLGLNSTLGVGTTNLMALGGANRINNCNVDCQMDWVGSAAGIIRASQLTETWLVSDDAACVMTDTLFINAASQTFLNHTSTGNVTLSNVTISTDQDPDVITGTGTVIFGSVVFVLNSDINVGITKQSVGNVETGPTHIGSGATDPTNHIEVIEEVIADDVTILALNTDNTDPASDTIVNLLTGGASGGDPFLHLEVSAASQYSLGIDNSDTDSFKITDGATPSAGNILWEIDGLSISNNRPWLFQDATVGGGECGIRSENNSTDVGSFASLEARANDPAGSMTFLRLSSVGVRGYSYGVDATDGDSLKMNTQTAGGAITIAPTTGTNLWRMSSAGERTLPLQPAFLGISVGVANVTGDGTVYTCEFGTEQFDQGGDYNNGTYTFTAPVTGKYILSCSHNLNTFAAGHLLLLAYIVTSNRAYEIHRCSPQVCKASNDAIAYTGSVVCDMDLGDTAYCTVEVQGGAKTVVWGTPSTFSGSLLC